MKRCLADDLAGEVTTGGQVDVARLLQRTSGSLLLRDQSGRFALLDLGLDDSTPGGVFTMSQRTVKATLNGKSSGYQLETSYDGRTCTVKLDGKTIFEQDLAPGLLVTAFWDPARPHDGATVTRPSLAGAANGMAALHGGGLAEAVQAALSPGDDAAAFVAQQLGIPSAAVQPAPKSTELKDSWIDQSVPGSLPFSTIRGAGADELLAPAQNLAEEVTPPPGGKISNLLVRWAPPHLPQRSGDVGLWTVTASMARAPFQGGVKSSVVSLQIQDPTPLSDVAATDCFRGRLAALTKHDVPSTVDTGIGVAEAAVEAPCRLLAQDFGGALLQDPAARAAITATFSRVGTGSSTTYLGWESLLGELFQKIVTAQTSPALIEAAILAQLDADRSAPVIAGAARFVSQLLTGASTHPSLEPLKDDLVGLGIAWGLAGRSLSADLLDALVVGAANAATAFPYSTHTMLSDLADDPMMSAEEVAFAQALTPASIDEMQADTAAARGLGLDQWADLRTMRFLQERPSMAQLDGWKQTTAAARPFVDREKQRLGEHFADVSPKANRDRVLGQALAEGWTPEVFTALEALADYGRVEASCSLDPDASSVVLCAAPLSRFSIQPGAFLAPDRRDRYVALARDFTGYEAKLASRDVERLELESAFFPQIWARCSAGEFDAKHEALGKMVEQLAAASVSDALELDSMLSSTLADCR